MKPLSLLMLTSLALSECGANNSPPKTSVPGEKTSAQMRTLETGAQIIPIPPASRCDKRLPRRVPFL